MKPRIYFARKLWVCRTDSIIGTGKTPSNAYRSWDGKRLLQERLDKLRREDEERKREKRREDEERKRERKILEERMYDSHRAEQEHMRKRVLGFKRTNGHFPSSKYLDRWMAEYRAKLRALKEKA